ncbi:hypothetical protein EDB85DRAFT_2030861 [Lactarius pseudohatsudake]|nr:hypothetical protein EDB85DRAFT_2030861 [Lactarius pseudohatsudake]
MEGRGPLGPGAQRCGHEGMSSLGLVVGANCRWWGSRGFLSLNDHWPLDKRHTRPRVPDLFSAANERPYRIYHWTRERLPFDGIYHRQNCWKTCAQGGIWANDVSCANCRSLVWRPSAPTHGTLLCPRKGPFNNGRLGHQSALSETKPLPRTTRRRRYLCSPICAILATRHSPARVVEAQPRRGWDTPSEVHLPEWSCLVCTLSVISIQRCVKH